MCRCICTCAAWQRPRSCYKNKRVLFNRLLVLQHTSSTLLGILHGCETAQTHRSSVKVVRGCY